MSCKLRGGREGKGALAAIINSKWIRLRTPKNESEELIWSDDMRINSIPLEKEEEKKRKRGGKEEEERKKRGGKEEDEDEEEEEEESIFFLFRVC